MEPGTERERSGLGGLFSSLISDLKGSYPLWDDLISKASKLQSQLRATVGAMAAFLDAFQRVADLASCSRGGTRDIGLALSRVCLRHRSLESKLRHLNSVFLDCLVTPLQEQMEDWKRSAHCLDKDHSKEYKRIRQEMKKRSSDSLKRQKKKKGAQGDSAVQAVSERHLLEELERSAVRRALLEERGRFCCLSAMTRAVLEEEGSLVSDVPALSEDLRILTMDPHKLPPSSEQVTSHSPAPSSEQVLVEMKSSESSWSFQSPPTSPTSTVSRKSSMSSSVNSVSSADSDAPLFRFRCGSSGPRQPGSVRLSSVSSHDSGFNSQDCSAPCCPAKDPDPGRELIQALNRGLDPDHTRTKPGLTLDLNRTHKDSAYSSQSHTPCCSEDHTGSEGDGVSLGADSEAEHRTERPPRGPPGGPPPIPQPLPSRRARPPSCASSVPTPGVATIRRAPSSKASLRRSSLGINLGTVPPRANMIPVKTPTVPTTEPLTPEPHCKNADRAPLTAAPPCPPPSTRGQPRPGRRGQEVDYLRLIRRGVKLKRTTELNDRSAPRIH